MKLTVILDEIPYPPIHGGRVDIWRRLQAFAAESVSLQVVYWVTAEDKPTLSDKQKLKDIASHVYEIRRGTNLADRIGTILRSRKRSASVSARMLSSAKMTRLVRAIKDFAPDAIWIDGIFGAWLGVGVAESNGLPVFYRSHNIESKYRQTQYEKSSNIRDKIAAWLIKNNIEEYEFDIMQCATHVWDISLDDMKFWSEKGIANIDWLPPFIDPALMGQLNVSTEHDFDLAYLGNLYTPNNIEGIKWFIFDVWPKITKTVNVRCLLAGTNPDPQILKWAQDAGITVIANAESASEIYSRAHILINPILSGSGMNVKSVEMLASGKPVVTCPQGVAGLPPKIADYFIIAETAAGFSKACVSALKNEEASVTNRDLEAFAFSAIKPVISKMRSFITSRK